MTNLHHSIVNKFVVKLVTTGRRLNIMLEDLVGL